MNAQNQPLQPCLEHNSLYAAAYDTLLAAVRADAHMASVMSPIGLAAPLASPDVSTIGESLVSSEQSACAPDTPE